MSQNAPPYEHNRYTVTDDDWQACYSIPRADSPASGMSVAIEHNTESERSVVSIPLTPRRARALVQLLCAMLEEAGESTGVWRIGEEPDGSWILDKDHDRPIYTKKPGESE